MYFNLVPDVRVPNFHLRTMTETHFPLSQWSSSPYVVHVAKESNTVKYKEFGRRHGEDARGKYVALQSDVLRQVIMR